MSKRRKKKLHKEKKLRASLVIGRSFLVFFATLLLLLFFVVGVVFVLLKGPSEKAKQLFALSCNETSAMKWVPSLFLTYEEYEAIRNPETEQRQDNTSVTKMSARLPVANFLLDEEEQSELQALEENLPELEILDIRGGTYKGKLMIVRDPSRVQIASLDHFGGAGKTLSEFLAMYDAIACTNAGGFEDEDGKGKGGIPDGLVIKNGQIVYGSASGYYNDVVGFDANHILHVGNMTGQDALNLGLVTATCFQSGPVLIKDGVRQTGFVSGINPRTAIGQTADGAILLIAIEGRMADSLGATFDDLTDILEEYGAINAGNMDGGSSSGMYYEGERITRSCSVIGDRPLPTAIVVSR